MRSASEFSTPFLSRRRAAPRWTGRAPHALRIIAGAGAVVAALAFLFAARPPEAALRSDLAASAAALRAMPATASPARVTAALRTALPGRAIQIDETGFPAVVAVTLRDLDWRSCVAAEHSARRLEGRVVVELEGYPAAEDCRDRNDMTWRLMP